MTLCSDFPPCEDKHDEGADEGEPQTHPNNDSYYQSKRRLLLLYLYLCLLPLPPSCTRCCRSECRSGGDWSGGDWHYWLLVTVTNYVCTMFTLFVLCLFSTSHTNNRESGNENDTGPLVSELRSLPPTRKLRKVFFAVLLKNHPKNPLGWLKWQVLQIKPPANENTPLPTPAKTSLPSSSEREGTGYLGTRTQRTGYCRRVGSRPPMFAGSVHRPPPPLWIPRMMPFAQHEQRWLHPVAAAQHEGHEGGVTRRRAEHGAVPRRGSVAGSLHPARLLQLYEPFHPCLVLSSAGYYSDLYGCPLRALCGGYH